MATAAKAQQPGQVWRDDCYYLNRDTGECERKYVLVLGVDAAGDAITAVFTSKPHGLCLSQKCPEQRAPIGFRPIFSVWCTAGSA